LCARNKTKHVNTPNRYACRGVMASDGHEFERKMSKKFRKQFIAPPRALALWPLRNVDDEEYLPRIDPIVQTNEVDDEEKIGY